MNRPKNNKIRRPQFLCIVGCEGKNQERIYFDKVAELVNCVEERTHDLVFDYAEPYGGNPKCVVERTIQKSIGKENKVSVFDYDGKKDKYANYAQTECQFRYCGTAIPFLTVRSTAR